MLQSCVILPLPGGFVGEDEDLYECALRESLARVTPLLVAPLFLLHRWPDRRTALRALLCIGAGALAVAAPALFDGANWQGLLKATPLQSEVAGRGVPLAQRRARAAQLLDSMGLGARAGFLPTHVSGGERQRAAVARALVNRPALLLADEPTGNLDSRAGEQVIELLVGHARSQQALLLVATHNPDIAAAMDRRIELLDGRRV